MLLSSKFSTIRYSKIQSDTIRHDTIQSDMIQFHTIRCHMIQNGTKRYDSIQCDTVRYIMVQYTLHLNVMYVLSKFWYDTYEKYKWNASVAEMSNAASHSLKNEIFDNLSSRLNLTLDWWSTPLTLQPWATCVEDQTPRHLPLQISIIFHAIRTPTSPSFGCIDIYAEW